MNNFILGTGFFGGNAELNFMATHWRTCVFNHYPEAEAFVVANGNSYAPMLYGMDNQCLRVRGNNGHVGQLISNEKQSEICGWSSTLLTLAMLAYMAEQDLVFLEQDVIFKGDVISKMYEDLGDKKMIFGGPMKTPPHMPCAQSLILIKHDFLLKFVQTYLSYGSENLQNLPEEKFYKLYRQFPDEIAFLSFGVDRERPIPWDEPYWYAQKLSAEEIEEAKRRGIL